MLPGLDWYRRLAGADIAVIDDSLRYDKRRKELHRFTVADDKGPFRITIPVSRPAESTPAEVQPQRPHLLWRDVRVSDHNHWWQQLSSAMATAYGGTPWFDYLWPDFADILGEDAVGQPVTTVCLALDAHVRQLLRLPVRVSATIPPVLPSDAIVTDLRRSLHADSDDSDTDTLPRYRQVREDTVGFIPGLSVLDVLFNEGPDATAALLVR